MLTMRQISFKRYKTELDYSYALGMAPVVELIGRRPDLIIGVYAHPSYKTGTGVSAGEGLNTGTGVSVGEGLNTGTGAGSIDIFQLCASRGLPCETNQKIFNITAEKENIYVIAAFRKERQELDGGLPHAVFVNPGDAGNLGTNIRTCLGFGIRDVAVITPGADVFSPKTVRASMGALFHIRAARFHTYAEYEARYPGHKKYAFMLDGASTLAEAADRRNRNDTKDPPKTPVSLIFGNEATGLPAEFHSLCDSVRIPHAEAIDSLNLSVAVGIAANAFYSAMR